MSLTVPALIKRNITLFALAQSFTGAGMQFAYGLGPLMVIALTGSSSLAGLAVGVMGLSRFVVSYPIGRVTDRYGRKPGILMGLAIALAGTVFVGLAMYARSFVLLAAGMLVFGMGMNAAQQLRVAAADMFPPRMRAQALGYVALGALAGLVLSPLLVGLSESIAQRFGGEPLALPWLMMPALIVVGMFLVTRVHPDPKEIGMQLEKYYPGQVLQSGSAHGGLSVFSIGGMLAHPAMRLAVVSNSAATGNMAIVMVLTSLVLAHHGHSLTAIAFSHVFHTTGMFAFTIPLGRLADRYGRERVMLPGVTVALVGALLVAFTEGYWMITLGTFLVGLGWAAANVAATALIADQVETTVRGRAVGVNDSFAGATSVLMALVTGPLIESAGLAAAGATAALIALPPLVMAIALRSTSTAQGAAARS